VAPSAPGERRETDEGGGEDRYEDELEHSLGPGYPADPLQTPAAMPSPSVDAVKAAFDAVDPMTVGLEEEPRTDLAAQGLRPRPRQP